MKRRYHAQIIPARARGHDGRPVEQTLALVVGNSIVPTRVPEKRTADGYLRVAAHLMLAAQRSGVCTVGVFSALNGEGKTTAAINLAASLGCAHGREGRILLIDGDLRQRKLSSLLGGAGRSEPMLVATGFEGVDYLSAPDLGPRPAIRAPSAWRKTLDQLASRYAQIIIDCPALLDDPEAVVLRECVDALVLVVRSGRTTRKTLERAVDGASQRVAGVILNGSRQPAPSPGGSAW